MNGYTVGSLEIHFFNILTTWFLANIWFIQCSFGRDILSLVPTRKNMDVNNYFRVLRELTIKLLALCWTPKECLLNTHWMHGLLVFYGVMQTLYQPAFKGKIELLKFWSCYQSQFSVVKKSFLKLCFFFHCILKILKRALKDCQVPPLFPGYSWRAAMH